MPRRKRKTEELVPGARRLIKSLRDLGYDFPAAVADLVDNSIEAKAKNIRIDFEWAGADTWLRIADDGDGMDQKTLVEAMRYGSQREYEDGSLGKFGLGLKTASTSQARQLTVASRVNKPRAAIFARQWDIDHVWKTDRWEILILEKEDIDDRIRNPLAKAPGTVVLWEKLDRIVDMTDPDGGHAGNRCLTMCRQLEEHLAMVFHRFLAGENRARRVKMFLNGNKIEPWDPFARSEKRTKALRKSSIKFEHEQEMYEFSVQPFVLPHQHRFSTPSAFDESSGPKKWNRQQGFYFYRENRMIQSGSWSKMRTIDEHSKLARIAIDFHRDLDEAFKINISKMRAWIPTDAKGELNDLVLDAIRAAKEEYNTGGRSGARATGGTAATATNRAVDRGGGQGATSRGGGATRGGGNSQGSYTVAQFKRMLMNAATRDEKTLLRKVFKKADL